MTTRLRFISQVFFTTLILEICALAQPGSLDGSFSGGGKFNLPMGTGNDGAAAVIVQPDGKIVVGGGAANGSGNPGFALARLNSNGSLDLGFNGTGKVTTTVANGGSITALALTNDGKIIAVGSATQSNSDFAVARYNPDGTLDQGFGVQFFEIGSGSDFANAVSVQTDGKIIIFGTANMGASGFDAAIIRIGANGGLDATFGNGGKVIIPVSPNRSDKLFAGLLQPDGKILAVGATDFNAALQPSFLLIRCNTDGSPDSTFDTDGIAVAGIGDASSAFGVALQTDNKIIAVGETASGTPTTSFALARFNSNGSLDDSFDGDGRVITDFSISSNDAAYAVKVQTNGKIVAAGRGAAETASVYDFGMIRLLPNGSLDQAFGSGGKSLTEFGPGDDIAAAMAIQTDGRIVLAGSANASGNTNFAIARHLGGEKSTRFDFDGDARADVSVFRPSSGQWWIIQSQSDTVFGQQFGLANDKVTPADFDGDGKFDLAVFRNGVWFWLNSSNGGFNAVQFGIAGDIPLPADYSGDGRADLAIYRAGVWWTLNLTTTGVSSNQFGNATDRPLTGDFDGDARIDQAVYRDGQWHLNRSSAGYSVITFGLATDLPVAADFDGDGRTDPAVYRSGVWYLQQSTQGFTAFQFGLAADVPAPADYDGDGKADAAVFRDGTWYLRQTANGISVRQFGIPSDRPLPTASLP